MDSKVDLPEVAVAVAKVDNPEVGVGAVGVALPSKVHRPSTAPEDPVEEHAAPEIV